MIETALPILVVGDVHGDLERLFQGLRPYPSDLWHTVFIGDLVDGGAFGVGALRYARDRPNSTVVLGNHEVAMLAALRDRSAIGSWLAIGGQLHDLEELRRDQLLQDWMRQRPALVKLPDGTVFQHSDNDGYARLLNRSTIDAVPQVNAAFRERLEGGSEQELWTALTPGGVFRRQPARLRSWLDRIAAGRVVHGHTPHQGSRPDSYHDGLAICFDGGLGRFWSGRRLRRRPLEASIGPLPVPSHNGWVSL